MALIWKSSVITQAIKDLLEEAHVPNDLKAVYYGDLSLIPTVPSCSVVSGIRNRNFNQTGLQYEIELTTYITIFHSLVADTQVLHKDLEELAELIEQTLNLARLLPDSGGAQRIIHGRVSSVEPGFASRGTSLFMAHRLTHSAISRQQVGT